MATLLASLSSGQAAVDHEIAFERVELSDVTSELGLRAS
jgi:hypothetical protein